MARDRRLTIADMPFEVRWAMRQAIEATGAVVRGYAGDCMAVALPNPASPAIEVIERAGYAVRDLYHFPLGSDAPAERLRHAVPQYGDARGFWLCAAIATESEAK